MTTREGTVTYRYDALDRLTEACWSSATCPSGAPAAPLACLACAGPLLPRPAGSLSPPAGETFRSYTYDPVGNRTAEASDAGGTTYAYDAADRLTSLTPPGQAAIGYSFDPTVTRPPPAPTPRLRPCRLPLKSVLGSPSPIAPTTRAGP